MYVFQDFDFKNYIGLFHKKNKQGWGGGGGGVEDMKFPVVSKK